LARSIVGVGVMSWLQPWAIGLKLDKSALKVLLSYGAKFQINDFLARIKDQLFYLVLGWYMPLKHFGYVQWAKNWSMYPYNLTVQNVMAITFPTFSRLQGHPRALSRAIEKSLFFITLFIFPMVVGMSLFVIPFISLVPKYEKWMPAAISLIFFSLSIAWSAISTPLTNTLNAIGQINTTLKLMVLWTVLTWVLTPLAMYFFGYNGIAIAALVIATTSFLPVYYVKNIVPINFLDQIWRQTVAVLVMAVVGVAGFHYWSVSISMFIVGIAITGISYFVAFLGLGWPKLRDELVSLRSK
jgi:teichuronic acid exporter